MSEVASSLRKILEPVAKADPPSRESVSRMIDALVAADAALRSGSPDSLSIAAEKMIAAYGSIGLAWRKYAAGSEAYDTLAKIPKAFAADVGPLRDELAQQLAARPPLTLVRHEEGHAF